MIRSSAGEKRALFGTAGGVSKSSRYYKPRMPARDWAFKARIELALREEPTFGHRRLAGMLKANKKKVLRVMNLFGIRPYRRRCKKWQKKEKIKVVYPNLLLTNFPAFPNHIWTADFTHENYGKKIVYIATVMDLFTRRIIGVSVQTTHAVQLVLDALMMALQYNPRPVIFHSDNGSEYNSRIFIEALETVGTQISRSAPGCPWENGYHESFHSQFKVDLGDPNRFETLGELVYAIYTTIWRYNNTRPHRSLGQMAPNVFARQHQYATLPAKLLETGS